LKNEKGKRWGTTCQFDPNFEKLVTLVSPFVVSPCFATSSTPPRCWPFSKRACWTWEGFRLLAKTGDPLFGQTWPMTRFLGGRPTRPLTTGQTDTANPVPNRLGWPPLPVTHRLTASQTTDKPPNKLGWPPPPVTFPDSADLSGSHQSHL